MLNVSQRIEREYVSILRAVDAAARANNVKFLVAGALVRDVLMGHAHGIHPDRYTRDADIAIALSDWSAFARFREHLLQAQHFEPTRVTHRLMFANALPVDLMPYGGVENAAHEIHWPDDEDVVMNMEGYAEAAGNAVIVRVGDDLDVAFADLPEFVCLKCIAWNDRYFRERKTKDAQDIGFLLRHYLDAGNQERLYAEHADLLDANDFDYETASARLLARDIASRVSERLRNRVLAIIDRGMHSYNSPLLAQSMLSARGDGRELGRYLRLLDAFENELTDK